MAQLVRCASHGDLPQDIWLMRQPAEATVIRSSLVFASAWTWLRHVRRWQEYPWLLATVADDRRTPAEHQCVADQFYARRACPRCVDIGHGRQLQASVRAAGAEWLLGPKSKRLHFEFAKSFDLQTDCRERKHAVHKKHFGSSTQMDYFVARSYVLDAKEIATRIDECRKSLAVEARPHADPEPAADRLGLCRSIDVYWHNKCSQRDRALGLGMRVCSTEYPWKVKVQSPPQAHRPSHTRPAPRDTTILLHRSQCEECG